MKKNSDLSQQGFKSLFPLILFFILYLGTGFICQGLGMEKPFNQLPSNVAAFLCLLASFGIVKGSAAEKLNWMVAGIAKPGIAILLSQVTLLGAFSAMGKACGGVDTIVAFVLKYVPAPVILPAFFLAGCFISFASSSGLLEIVSLGPVAISVAQATGISIPLTVGTVMGAAAFGVSSNPVCEAVMISNNMLGLTPKASRQKMGAQLKLYMTAALLTTVLLLLFGRSSGTVAVDTSAYTMNAVSLIPYVVTLGLALAGVNYFLSLSAGILSGFVITVSNGTFTLFEACKAVSAGFSDNANMIWMFIFISGLLGVVTATGGVDWLVGKLSVFIKGHKSAEIVVFVMGVIVTCCIGNNSIPMLATEGVANRVIKEYKIDPRRMATIFTSACITVDLLPHSGMGLGMAGVMESAGVSANFVQSIPFNFFVLLTFALTVVNVFVPVFFRGFEKDKWSFAHNCTMSEAEAGQTVENGAR